jgi:hypothetical protein
VEERLKHQPARTEIDDNEEIAKNAKNAKTHEKLARPARLERATLGSASRCSIQLSYGRAEFLRVGSE